MICIYHPACGSCMRACLLYSIARAKSVASRRRFRIQHHDPFMNVARLQARARVMRLCVECRMCIFIVYTSHRCTTRFQRHLSDLCRRHRVVPSNAFITWGARERHILFVLFFLFLSFCKMRVHFGSRVSRLSNQRLFGIPPMCIHTCVCYRIPGIL